MSSIRARKRLLKRLAQAATPGTAPASADPSATTTAPATATPAQPATINIRALPSFRADLFALRPDIIGNLQQIANILNGYMLALSNNMVSFNVVWQAPGVNGSQYSNSMKNMVNIAKWLYSVMISNEKQYTMQGLYMIGTALISMVRGMSFPDSQATGAQQALLNAGTLIIGKLNPPQK